MQVWATREGLPGKRTASGYVIDAYVSFVALPSGKALHKHVRITNPLNGKSCMAEVLDVGPHSDSDDAYVFGGARPLAEQGISIVEDIQRVAANRAGIDLGGYVWEALRMLDNGDVIWEWVI